MQADQKEIAKLEDKTEKDKLRRKKVVDGIASIDLEMSEHFIRVRFKMKNGTNRKYEAATLCHKIRNMDDSIGLLKMAGIKVTKPKLNDLAPADARIIAMKALDDVRHLLIQTLEDFRGVALYFIKMKQDDGLSIADRFFSAQTKALGQSLEFIAAAKEELNATIKRNTWQPEEANLAEKINIVNESRKALKLRGQ